jgi:hypothetical protein
VDDGVVLAGEIKVCPSYLLPYDDVKANLQLTMHQVLTVDILQLLCRLRNAFRDRNISLDVHRGT